MPDAASPSLARQLGVLFEGGSAAGLSDRQLLERFTASETPDDEAAFAAIVARHGPMVLGICRQLLSDHHHAEDAFQATFFVLARRARSIRDPDRLGVWLYGVALRTAGKARARLARRRRTEQDGAIAKPESDPAVSAEQVFLDREQAEALHREIDRLPGAFRASVLLCYFEGLTLDEAARRLGWPVGTVRSRLARAREKLRRALMRGGVSLPAAVFDFRPAPPSVSSLLCDSTTRAAIRFAARRTIIGTPSASAAALAREVLRTMIWHRLKAVALTLLLLAAGAGVHALGALTDPRGAQPAGGPRAQTPRTDPQSPSPTRPAPGRMLVAGRVLDPQGKPVAGAAVSIHARKGSLVSNNLARPRIPMGVARTDSSGRYQIDAPRTSSVHYDSYFEAVALASGYGAGWADLDVDDDQPGADIALRAEQVIQGRLFDLQGQPAAGVTVSVQSIGRIPPPNPATRRPQFVGVNYSRTQIVDKPSWPKPATTDSEGRFTLRGVGRDLRVVLMSHHPRFALQEIEVVTDGTPGSKSLTAALVPAQVLTGRVTYADTGQGVPHASLEVMSPQGKRSLISAFETDAEGRFRVNPPPTDSAFHIAAFPPEGRPYLIAERPVKWPKGALEQSVDFALPRGVSIRGKVVEKGSGKPIPGASVGFFPFGVRATQYGRRIEVDAAADGSFQIGAEPKPGYLFVRGSSDDYLLEEIGNRALEQGQAGGARMRTHAHIKLDLKPGTDIEGVQIALRRGVTVNGRVVGPDGQSVREAWIFSRIILDPKLGVWRPWSGRTHGNVRDGRFELHGLDPDAETPVTFYAPESKLGATVNLSGKSIALMTIASRAGRVEPGATIAFSGGSGTRGPITVRLEPCGSARARLVDPDGKVVAGRLSANVIVMMVVTPGPLAGRASEKSERLNAEEARLGDLDPIHYGSPLASDAEGRLTLPVLIPGATYRLVDFTAGREAPPQVRREFTARPRETVDLGDILIEKPTR